MGLGIPELADCRPGLRAVGFSLIVAVPPTRRQTTSGLHLPDSAVEKNQMTEVRGRIASISPAAFDFANFPKGTAAYLGDIVQFARLAGVMMTGADGREYRVIQDKDVLAVVEDDNNG